MARLFGAEFHEHSNTWFFKSSILELKKDDVLFKKFLDEKGNVIFKFEASDSRKKYFKPIVTIVYQKKKQDVIFHECSECGTSICKHYLSVINYSYNYLSTDIVKSEIVQTYQARLMNYNEYWQRIALNGKIEIGEIFNVKTDKIRFYITSYLPMNLPEIIKSLNVDSKNKIDKSLSEQIIKQMKALSFEELNLFTLIQKWKCSFSKKGCFYSIYKKDFVNFFMSLKNLVGKIYIKETGDKISFSDDDFRLNLSLKQNSEGKIILKTSPIAQISAFYIGRTTYIFKKNEVYSIQLPFIQEISEQIFQEGFPIKKNDLVYFYTIVAKQLGLIKCYLDFDESIKFPDIYNNEPQISFKLFKKDNSIILEGSLNYEFDVQIPMSLLRFPSELIRFDIDSNETWFYIPPQIKYQVFGFVEKLPQAIDNNLDEKSQLIFTDEENIDKLKKVIFELSEPSWNIELSDELKNEFVYRVELKPIILPRVSDKIDWFEYDVRYNYQDISLTHSELKKFFSRNEKFLKLEDGRLLYFENKSSFQEIDKIINLSQKTSSESHKLLIYNLPFIYQLANVQSGIQIQGDKYLETMFSNILKRKIKNKTVLPLYLQPIMRSYQKAGYHWLKMLEYYNFSGILADDMGLGKTIQAISVLSDIPYNSVCLVICPKTLLFNWAEEIKKFNKNMHFMIYEGTQNERKLLLKNLNVNILIASYSIIQNDLELLQKIDFEYIILDEAQHIKNDSALRTKAVKKLNGKHKIALSGTPVENRPSELWSIFDFLMPGYLPTIKKLKKNYSDYEDSDRKILEQLKMMVTPFILRRKKSEVLIELPDKQEQLVYAKMTELQEKMYLQILDVIQKDFSQNKQHERGHFLHILAALTKLRQLCNHPHLLDNDIKLDFAFSGKTELLKEIIQDAVESGKKILVFSQFVGMLQILKAMMQKLKIQFEYMDGSSRNRQKIIDNFNNNNLVRVFLISLKTGGYGLNLTAADTVIIVDPWWNPMGENQAIDRAHRIGQTKKVNVYKIITKGTVEEKILDLQYEKKEMFNQLIEDGKNMIKGLTFEKIKRMFTLNL
ncbi:MAG: DEAD/DEAH box helicase [Candidatus Cloacimonetes bacterium]|nr:DEAD/DEAH box helicase [Candidatus Cloacimonadota bacterium]